MKEDEVPLAKISLHVDGFHSELSRLNGLHELNVSRAAWIWAAATVGNPSRKLRWIPKFESTWRQVAQKAVSALANVSFRSGRVNPSDMYWYGDKSEKAAISYQIGMTAAKLFANEILEIPFLVHADHFRRASLLDLLNPLSHSLADLIGLDVQLNWHVIEAKGAGSEPSPRTQAKWKGQAQTISMVNGQDVKSNSYSLAILTDPIFGYLQDPPADGDALDIRIAGSGGFLETYYRPLQEFVLEQTDQILDERVLQFQGNFVFSRRAIRDDNVSVYIGLHASLFEQPFLGQPALFSPFFEQEDDLSFFLGPDGVLVLVLEGPKRIAKQSPWRR